MMASADRINRLRINRLRIYGLLAVMATGYVCVHLSIFAPDVACRIRAIHEAVPDPALVLAA